MAYVPPGMSRRNTRPLDVPALNALALSYLGRYATTRRRLFDYLARKVRERGWAGEGAPPLDAVVARCAELGYVDDAGFAASRGAALARRGLGEARIAAALHASGIDAETAAPVRAAAREEGLAAALAFARRKRIGPFADTAPDRDRRQRQLAALLRAGHPPDIARRVVDAAPGEILDDE